MGKSVNQTILALFQKHGVLNTAILTKKLGISRQAVHRHLVNLMHVGKIIRQGSGNKNTSYILNTPKTLKQVHTSMLQWHQKTPVSGLEEDRLFKKLENQPLLLAPFNSNSRRNLHYAFTEMVNNAIDHSKTKYVIVNVAISKEQCRLEVRDTGIGIFENIAKKKHLHSEMEAIQDLLKGKQTTSPSYHSGEGIFFTSKIARRFVIESHKKRLIIDNQVPDIFIENIRFKQGTEVTIWLAPHETKKLEDIFNEYTNESFEFNKTKVTIKLHQEENSYISRSQAKRVLHSLDSFTEITLDFKGVNTIGQGFADEVFRVFQNNHPEKKILAINTDENVEFMIRRAQSKMPRQEIRSLKSLKKETL
ncbi:MAG TPA: hypothetical protein DDW49_01510 [Deltaproteobacteria bacterium]|nr:MAG: hypothetical protein A2048_10390 [Deltaproteobacteria bacterium GWA2_45_12]HBF12060.1 hypothetical protein [Deltaproteobacteria bacterium]